MLNVFPLGFVYFVSTNEIAHNFCGVILDFLKLNLP